MLAKITLAVALVLGAAAAAQAGQDVNGGAQGGYDIGPMGQRMGGPAFFSRGRGPFAYSRDYAYVPRHLRRRWRYER